MSYNTSMNVCSSGHDEVCYVGNTCPLCAEMEDRAKDIKELQETVDGLNRELEKLQDIIDINTANS